MSDQEKEELAEQNMLLVWFVVNQYAGASTGCDELYSAALFGMARALSAYDETAGIKFSTFAVACMKHEILNLLRVAKRRRLDISYESNIRSPDNGNEMLDESFANAIPTESTMPDEITTKIVVRDFVEQLSDRNREILRLRMRGLQQKDIAAQMGVSQQRIGRLLIEMREKLWNELYFR